MHLGELCRKAREALGLSLEEFATLAQVTAEELAAFEQDPRQRGRDTLPRVTHAFRLCKAEIESRAGAAEGESAPQAPPERA